MRSLFAVTDPEGVIETAAYNIRIELAAVSVVHLSLKGVTEAVIGHAFQLGDSPAIGFQSRNAIGVAQDLDRKSTRLNSSHIQKSRMPSSA